MSIFLGVICSHGHKVFIKLKLVLSNVNDTNVYNNVSDTEFSLKHDTEVSFGKTNNRLMSLVLTNINLGGGGSEGEYERGEDLAGARNDADHGVIQLHEVTEDADGE